MNDNKHVKKNGWVGFAELFLQRFRDKSLTETDLQVFAQLVELDSRLGTTASEQLTGCLLLNVRWNVLKV